MGVWSLLQSLASYNTDTQTEPGFPAMSCGALTPSIPTRAWIWQQLGLAAFVHSWFSKASPLQGTPPFKTSKGREDKGPAKPILEPREGIEVPGCLMRLCTICWARRLQATGCGASDKLQCSSLPSAVCGLLPSSSCFVVLVLLSQKATWTFPPAA